MVPSYMDQLATWQFFQRMFIASHSASGTAMNAQLQISPSDPRLQPYIKQEREKAIQQHTQTYLQNGDSYDAARKKADSFVRNQLERANPMWWYQSAVAGYQQELRGPRNNAPDASLTVTTPSGPSMLDSFNVRSGNVNLPSEAVSAPSNLSGRSNSHSSVAASLLADAQLNAQKSKKSRFDITASDAMIQKIRGNVPQPILSSTSGGMTHSSSLLFAANMNGCLDRSSKKLRYSESQLEGQRSQEARQRWITRVYEAHQVNRPPTDADKLWAHKLKSYCDDKCRLYNTSLDWSAMPVPSRSEIESHGTSSDTVPAPPTGSATSDMPVKFRIRGSVTQQSRSRSVRNSYSRSIMGQSDASDTSETSTNSVHVRGVGPTGPPQRRAVGGSGERTAETGLANTNSNGNNEQKRKGVVGVIQKGPSASGVDVAGDFISLNIKGKAKGKSKGKWGGKGNVSNFVMSQRTLFELSDANTIEISSEEQRKRSDRMLRFEKDDILQVNQGVRRMTWKEQLNMMKNCKPVMGLNRNIEKQYLRLTGPPDPAMVRPESVLKKSFMRVIELWISRDKDYRWVEEQFRSIRQDLSVQRIKNAFTIQVYETNARIALENSDLGQFNQCQTQLGELYRIHKIELESSHRAEFVCYKMLYMALQNLKLDLLKLCGELSDAELHTSAVSYAFLVRKALGESNYHRFFKLVPEAPGHSKYLLSIFIPRIRMEYLLAIAKSFYTLQVELVAKAMVFASVPECLRFLNQQKTVWVLGKEQEVIDCRKSYSVYECSGLLVSRKQKALG